MTLFVLAFEEIKYSKGNVAKTNVVVTDKEAAEKGAQSTDGECCDVWYMCSLVWQVP